MAYTVGLEEVESYWSSNPCNSDLSTAVERRKYFDEIAERRYTLEHHIPECARFTAFAGKKVLEVGCGVGTDGRSFARNGAIYTGINLDQGSTDLARESFEVHGLPGTLLKMNGEAMSFAPETFDHVYSMGVIHHSPHPEEILREVFRVLKPGGTITVMLYNRSSVNYYLEIMFLRKLFRFFLLPSFGPGALARIIGLDREKLEKHREILLREKMTHDRWVSINTDGPDCPLARVYSASEVRDLFTDAGFHVDRTYARFFHREHYGFLGRLMPGWFADRIGRIAGWHRWVDATKPT